MAYERAQGRDRFITARDVHRLPRWGRASPDSIGKSIYRHARQMRAAGLDLIESPPRGATKLFRLRHEDISFDVPLPEVRTFLGLDLAIHDPSSAEVSRTFRFSWATVLARVELERGNLAKARAALEEAECVPSGPVRECIQLRLLRSSVLEHEGRFREALAETQQALEVSLQHGVDYLTLARVRIRLGFLGSMLRQPQRYPEARSHYYEAQRLLEDSRHFIELGQIATGLGHLARRVQDLESALAFFLRALECATAEGSGWGIQAALFNLGLVQAERGDALKTASARRIAYQDARAWLERAIEFTDRTGVGRYSSEALSVLSHVLLQLGKAGAAVRWAKAALERARSVGNKKSEAVALEALGQSLRALGATEEALKALRDSHAMYLEISFQPDAQRVTGLIADAARGQVLPRTKAG